MFETRMLITSVLCAAACGGSERDRGEVTSDAQALENRAYIVSLESDELTVIDLGTLDIVGQVLTRGVMNHMAELNGDFTKIYVDSSHTDEAVVVDARTLQVTDRILVGKHPSHLSLSPDGRLLAIMNEEENSVSFVDPSTDTEVKRLPGFYTPHFMRFDRAGQYGYVANIGAHHVTRVDLGTLEIDREIVLDGFRGSPEASLAPDEGGFGDVQIAQDGILYAAHAATGRVLAYDTLSHAKFGEIQVGERPWVAFAEHPFADVPLRHLVPNFGSRTVSMIDGRARKVVHALPGDEEAYGVNYNTVEPGVAYVMNRTREDISVVDLMAGDIVERIPVGGNTETASTTADGRLIVATVSSANRVVVIDAATRAIKKVFENVGKYPWSVTIPRGQNYCH